MSEVHYAISGCPLPEVLPRDPVPFFTNGDLNFKAHDVGWLVAGLSSIIATWASVWLIMKHLSFFYHPSEQRMIVRILFMPIIYGWCSFMSYYFVHDALYWQLARDCYEAIIIGSFFYLLLSYLSNPRPTPEDPFPEPYRTQAERSAQLRSTVKAVRVKRWIWPFGFVKWRPGKAEGGEGEAFLWWMRCWVGQYVIIRPLTTLAAVISHYFDYYCLVSWSPKFVHVWSSGAITISVTLAMYAVLQLYVVLKKDLEPYSPILKFLAVKLVVFFTFWQESALSLLVTIGVIKSRTYWSAEDIVVGIAGLLSCFEMMLFAFMHVKAFSYLPYRALASPIPLDSSPLLDDKASDELPLPGKHLTFAEWSAWDKQVKEREKDRLRLAKPKLPKRSGDLPATKPDGNPILQQTKKWPAFVKCLRLTDLAREIAEETRFVVRGGKLGMTEELLEEGRKDDYEAVKGKARPLNRQAEMIERGENGLHEDLQRLLRSGGQRVSLEGTKIDENGERVSKKGRGKGRHAWSNEEDRVMEEGRSLLGDGEEVKDRQGWSNETSSYYTSRAQIPDTVAISSTFEQVPRLDPLRTTTNRPPSRSRPLSFPPRLSYSPDNIPFMAADSTIPFPAPHRLNSLTLLLSDSVVPAPQSGRQSLLPSDLVRKEEHTRDITTETSSSKDSFGHLPQLQIRPSSFIPPHQTLSPSPPPFSHWTTSNPAVKRSIPTTKPAYSLPINSISPLDSLLIPSAPSAPAAAFLGPGRSTPRFLPPGAAPSHIIPLA